MEILLLQTNQKMWFASRFYFRVASHGKNSYTVRMSRGWHLFRHKTSFMAAKYNVANMENLNETSVVTRNGFLPKNGQTEAQGGRLELSQSG